MVQVGFHAIKTCTGYMSVWRTKYPNYIFVKKPCQWATASVTNKLMIAVVLVKIQVNNSESHVNCPIDVSL